ncbi:hypothetical protein [Sebaldella sp. S0638]|uniref:hypothetical protein n=1 Tax=Sebaldella sp. S0638 TaxID=2957809 RepID=UPI00209D04B2|nr:hypothetical protein [Sebaldella sp. S0638]MCP1226199.1 hypothetical protein [Sebaldella sp. S0638]
MKRIGYIFILAVLSSFVYADDLKELKFNTGYGAGNMDSSKFQYGQFFNELSGKILLDDEWAGLMFNFDATKRNFYNTDGDSAGDAWATDFYLSKGYKLGGKESELMLGFKYGNSDNVKIGYFDGLIPLKQLNGHGYEFYLGSMTGFTFWGQQQFSITPRVVYYNDHDKYTMDYKDTGTEGIGGDLDLAVGGPILLSKYGNIIYGVQLNNHLRKPTNAKNTGSDKDSSVYLNYIALLTYSSPRYYGFGLDLNVVNQWERLTGDHQQNNGFYVSPKLLYSHTFDTGIGKFTVNPYVSYNVVDEQNRKINFKDKYLDYSGNNELTGGIEFSLARE